MFTFASKGEHTSKAACCFMCEQLRAVKLPAPYYFQNFDATALQLEYPFSILKTQSLTSCTVVLTIGFKGVFGPDLQ